jgi:hypothetical protein
LRSKICTHEPKSFFAVFVEHDRQPLQERDALALPELREEAVQHIRMRFRIDALVRDLVERKDAVSYYAKYQPIRQKVAVGEKMRTRTVHEQVDARLERRDLAGAERHRDRGWALRTFSFGLFAIASSRTRHCGDGHDDVQVKVHFPGDARQIPTTTRPSFSSPTPSPHDSRSFHFALTLRSRRPCLYFLASIHRAECRIWNRKPLDAEDRSYTQCISRTLTEASSYWSSRPWT